MSAQAGETGQSCHPNGRASAAARLAEPNQYRPSGGRRPPGYLAARLQARLPAPRTCQSGGRLDWLITPTRADKGRRAHFHLARLVCAGFEPLTAGSRQPMPLLAPCKSAPRSSQLVMPSAGPEPTTGTQATFEGLYIGVSQYKQPASVDGHTSGWLASAQWPWQPSWLVTSSLEPFQ